MAVVAASVAGASLLAAGASSSPVIAHFQLFPAKKFLPCMSAPGQTPTANVTVIEGSPTDQLVLSTAGFKPGIQFDVFTVQRSNQAADGSPVAGFPGFGLAWYQSDLEGNHSTFLRTILVNQIFGFDSDAGVSLPPTNTFHLGFWFNNPADAAPCGFTGTTPFNGDHTAGPLAFISRPDPVTGLGPLCLSPSSPGRCNP